VALWSDGGQVRDAVSGKHPQLMKAVQEAVDDVPAPGTANERTESAESFKSI